MLNYVIVYACNSGWMHIFMHACMCICLLVKKMDITVY